MKETTFTIQQADDVLHDLAQAVYKTTQTGGPLVVLVLDNTEPSKEMLDRVAKGAVVLLLRHDSEQFKTFCALFHYKDNDDNKDIVAPCVLLTEQSRIVHQWPVSETDEASSWDTQLGNLLMQLRISGYSDQLFLEEQTTDRYDTPQVTSADSKCALRIKLDDSTFVEHSFNACTTSLKDVKEYVANVLDKKLARDLAFHSVLPKRRYTKTEERMSLNTLDLMPRSTLYLLKNKKYIRELRRTRDASQDFKYIMFCVNKIRSMFHIFPMISRSRTTRAHNGGIHTKSFTTASGSGIDRLGSAQSGSCHFNNPLPDGTSSSSSNNQN
ncbi:hypothetical protein DAKH74_014140 [Maudiozyma humilis]|uniref:UBX domain-containing protein n=1 Tax=Maudiozyma humilis TaxID=51915 RepID=A0AAV5RTP1_MAUHU|nr:hypothetical protein DAKH74_014140 [Kazachstania humilis]